MDITKIPVGKKSPEQINVLIEIPAKSGQVKYEFNKRLGIVEVDRFMQTELEYPCHYGFMPNTLSGDSDPIDVLVYTKQKLHPGVLIKVRPIAVLMTEDENGSDEKILAVPIERIDPSTKEINSHLDLPQAEIDEIVHFFENYKKNEVDKWVKVSGWEDAAKAKELITKSVEAFNSHGGIIDTITEFKDNVVKVIKEFQAAGRAERLERESRSGGFGRDSRSGGRDRDSRGGSGFGRDSRGGGGSRERSSGFSRDSRPSFGSRDRDDRGRGGRDDRGGSSFGRDSRPSFGSRDRDDRGRSSFGRNSSGSGERSFRPRSEGSGDRDNRSRDFGDRPKRSFESGSSDRDRRPSYSRDDRGGNRDGGARRDFGDRSRGFGSRDSRPHEDSAKSSDTLKVKKKENADE